MSRSSLSNTAWGPYLLPSARATLDRIDAYSYQSACQNEDTYAGIL